MSEWLNNYEDFLLKNAGQITSIESTLRSLSFLLPGRYKDVEVVSESVYSILQIIGMYHDRVLVKLSQKAAAEGQLPDNRHKSGLSAHNRYVLHVSTHSRIYRQVSLILSLIRFSEMLMEMLASAKDKERNTSNYGLKSYRGKTILSIETLKALLRLWLLFKQRRPVLRDPVLQREVGSEELAEEYIKTNQFKQQNINNEPAGQQVSSSFTVLKRTKLRIPVETPLNPREYLASKVIYSEDVKNPVNLLHVLKTGLGVTSEVIYIIRPVVYALLMLIQEQKSRSPSKGKSNSSIFKSKWTPWLVGLSMELMARSMAVKNYKETLPGGLRSLTALEAQELGSRKLSLWWYTLRGAMYDGVTRPILQRMVTALDLPLISLVSGILDDYIYLLDTYYYSSSSL